MLTFYQSNIYVSKERNNYTLYTIRDLVRVQYYLSQQKCALAFNRTRTANIRYVSDSNLGASVTVANDNNLATNAEDGRRVLYFIFTLFISW